MAVRLAEPLLPILCLLLLRAVTCARGIGGDDDDSAFVYAGCSQGRYDAGSQYESSVDSVLTSLANSAPYTPYANATSPLASSLVAGLYQCRSDLPASVCTGCVRSAISGLSKLCSWAAGGAVQLRSCFVRYGNDSFVGKQDTAVLFKKCGGSPRDAGTAAMRDSALSGLAAAVAPAARGACRPCRSAWGTSAPRHAPTASRLRPRSSKPGAATPLPARLAEQMREK